jgi:hypothetical protein
MNFHSMLELFDEEEVEIWVMFEKEVNEIVDG